MRRLRRPRRGWPSRGRQHQHGALRLHGPRIGTQAAGGASTIHDGRAWVEPCASGRPGTINTTAHRGSPTHAPDRHPRPSQPGHSSAAPPRVAGCLASGRGWAFVEQTMAGALRRGFRGLVGVTEGWWLARVARRQRPAAWTILVSRRQMAAFLARALATALQALHRSGRSSSEAGGRHHDKQTEEETIDRSLRVGACGLMLMPAAQARPRDLSGTFDNGTDGWTIVADAVGARCRAVSTVACEYQATARSGRLISSL